jgi:hypothetical protein
VLAEWWGAPAGWVDTDMGSTAAIGQDGLGVEEGLLLGSARAAVSTDRGYVRSDQGGGLLVNVARSTIAVAVLKVRKGHGRGDRV